MGSDHTRTTGRVQLAGSFASQPVAFHSAARPASAIARGNALSISNKAFLDELIELAAWLTSQTIRITVAAEKPTARLD